MPAGMNIEVSLLAMVVGANLFIGLFYVAAWIMRGRRAELEPWIAAWALVSGGAVAVRAVQLSTQEPAVAIWMLKVLFALICLLVPILFQMTWIYARRPGWRRVGWGLWGLYGIQAVLALTTDLYAQSQAHLRTGLFGEPFLGVPNGAMGPPFLISMWLSYGLVVAVLRTARVADWSRRMALALFTIYLGMGSLELFDGLGLLDMPGTFPYAFLVQSLGLAMMGVVSFAQVEQELERQRETLAERARVLDQALVEARSATRARTRFVANMSHELRTPLNGVLGMAQLLERTQLDATQTDYLRALQDSGRGLLALIRDVLDFSKIDAGELVLERREFPLLPLFEEALAGVAPAALSKGLELALIPGPGVPRTVFSDEARLRQILVNLLGNAVKFTERGQVVLRVGLRGGELFIEVQDSGIGIAQDRQGELFKPFVQADDSTTRRFGGTGLGLAITGELVRAMGGQIQLWSRPGQGSRFTITLPVESGGFGYRDKPRVIHTRGLSALQREELTARLPASELRGEPREGEEVELLVVTPAALRSDEGAARVLCLIPRGDEVGMELAERKGCDGVLSHPLHQQQLLEVLAGIEAAKLAPVEPSEGGRILLVEDNPINQLVVQQMLNALGYEVVVANNGREALERLDGIELVLMDCQMPEMDGYEATRALRLRGVGLPVVGLSANALVGDAEKAIQAGMDAYLTKPVAMRSLAAVVRERLQRRAG